MKTYLFVSNVQNESIQTVSRVLEQLIRKEKPDKLISLGDVNGSNNGFIQKFQESNYLKIRLSPDILKGVSPETFDMQDLKVVLKQQGLEELLNVVKNDDFWYVSKKKKHFLIKDMFLGFYPFVVSYVAREVDSVFLTGCEDYFKNFFLFKSKTTKSTLFSLVQEGYDDDFVYFPGTDRITGSKTVVSNVIDSGSYTCFRTGDEKWNIPRELDGEMKELYDSTSPCYQTKDFGLYKLPNDRDKALRLDFLLSSSHAFKTTRLKIVNPLSFAKRLDLEDKIVVSHIPLGEAYNEINSPIRILSHGIECGEGMDLSGNEVEPGKWTDELILNPTDIDEGKIGLLYEDKGRFSYKIYSIRK